MSTIKSHNKMENTENIHTILLSGESIKLPV